MPLTPLFAALLGLMYVFLSVHVITLRFKNQVSMGDGDNSALRKAIRIHGNFIEYVPLALILLWFLETIVAAYSLVFYSGSLLVVARILHVIGMRNPREWLILRQIGVILTLSIVAINSGYLLYWYLPIHGL